jgi:branched-chain amino acid transport system permease protein
VVTAAVVATAILGVLVARFIVLPVKSAPQLNVLLVTLMMGTVLRESIRLFYPGGDQPKMFPALLPAQGWNFGAFHLRFDNVILLVCGALLIAGTHLLITRTRLGLAIRAVAQDEETARTMGIDFRRVVLVTFALGSALAAFAGVMDGLYYNEVFFSMGLLLGVIGFASAIIGGLGNLYGAIVGGFFFAALQTIGAVALPFASAYKDVFAFGVVILLMALRPTGLIGERASERV